MNRPKQNPRAKAPLLGEGLVTRHVVVPAKNVVFVKGVLEAHEGLAQVFAESGGDLVIATTESQTAELDALLPGLLAEVGGFTRDA
ncbi:MAG: hypothetical protein U0174_05515 [Polyangiaceae bacterium]